MNKYLFTLWIFTFAFLGISCQNNHHSSDLEKDLNLSYTVYKKADNFYSISSDEDPFLKTTYMDFDANVIKDIEIDEPGLYLFIDINLNRIKPVYFKEKITTTYYKIKQDNEDLQWLEDHIDFFRHFKNGNEVSDEILSLLDIPKDYLSRVESLEKLTGIEKNILLSIIQDIYVFKYFIMEMEGKEIPKNIELSEIINKEQYMYNLLTSDFLINDNLKIKYIDENLKNFIILKNIIVRERDFDKALINLYQNQLDSMATILPDLYQRAPDLFHISFNVKNALENYTVLNENKDSIYVSEYLSDDYTIFYFWGTWCYPCKLFEKEKMGTLKSLAKEKGISIITIASESIKNFDLWTKELEGEKKDLLNFFGFSKFKEGHSGPAVNDIFAHLNVTAFPNLMIIDKNGNIIISKDVEGEKTMNFIKKL